MPPSQQKRKKVFLDKLDMGLIAGVLFRDAGKTGRVG